MKKVLAAVCVVCVMCVAGAAIAQPDVKREHRNQQTANHPEISRNVQERSPRWLPSSWDRCGDFRPGFDGRHMPCGFDGRGEHRGPKFTPDMPKEIREKAVDLAKLRVDLEEALTSRPMNKAKALEVYAKMQKLEQDIDTWRFEQKLERIEAMQRQRELNRKVPPAKAPEVPQTETEQSE